jgi:ComF family protein
LTGFDAVYWYGSYEGTLRRLIHLLKYERIQSLARPFGDFLARVVPREQRFDCVVPMPLHWRRHWERGFNQSELLAREIARRWNVPVHSAVKRIRATPPQAGLTNAERRANVSGAFAIRRPLFSKRRSGVEGARVLLVDDVLTTGASAAACARALKRAGAVHVALLTLARTDRRTAVLDSEAALENNVPAKAVAAGGGKA